MGLAPHTCVGIIGRIIGFTDLNVIFAHPFWHSAKRRDCDGDEDCIIMALDAFLNFSKEYLPDQIGGIMDSPIFTITNLNPSEVQRQAHEFDVTEIYPKEFYNKTELKSRYLVYVGIIFALLALVFQLYQFSLISSSKNFSKYYLLLIFIPYAIYIFYSVKNNQNELLYFNIIFLFFYLFTAYIFFR